MGYLKEFTLKTDSEGAYNITREITSAIVDSGVEDGIAFIFCPHTTAGVTITENTDKNVTDDMISGLKLSFPDRSTYNHAEGNSFAHIKSSVVGCQITIPVDAGWPMLGPWQGVFFIEFDGPRERRYNVKVIEC